MLVLDPKNTKVAVAFPIIFPPEPVIEPMAVIPEVSVKFPEVMVNALRESVNAPVVKPPKVTPPAPFKIKLAGYLLNISLGKVTALVFVNLTVPPGAEICPVCVVPLRETAPFILNVPVDTSRIPDVNTIVSTAVVPDVKIKFPEVMVKDPKESATEPLVFPPKVTPPAPFKVKFAG